MRDAPNMAVADVNREDDHVSRDEKDHTTPHKMLLNGHRVLDRQRLPFNARRGLSPPPPDDWETKPLDPDVNTRRGWETYNAVADDYKPDGEISERTLIRQL